MYLLKYFDIKEQVRINLDREITWNILAEHTDDELFSKCTCQITSDNEVQRINL